MPTFRVVRSPLAPTVPSVRAESARGPGVATIHAANDAYIDALLGDGEWPSGAVTLPLSLLHALRSLTRVQRRRISALPFTLFSLRFSDVAFWRDLVERPTEPVRRGDGREAFCRTAVFLAWHLAQSGPSSAGMALGMSSDVVALYQWVPLSDLERLAVLAQPAIAPRWPAHSGFWRRLMDAARYPSSIDAARYFGLHLLAGECLPREESRLRA